MKVIQSLLYRCRSPWQRGTNDIQSASTGAQGATMAVLSQMDSKGKFVGDPHAGGGTLDWHRAEVAAGCGKFMWPLTAWMSVLLQRLRHWSCGRWMSWPGRPEPKAGSRESRAAGGTCSHWCQVVPAKVFDKAHACKMCSHGNHQACIPCWSWSLLLTSFL